MLMNRTKIPALVLLIVLLFSSSLQAVEYRPSEWKKEPLYIDRAFGKLNFGFWNFLFGWTEILTEPYEAAMTDQSILIGAGKGVLFGAANTVGGFLNTVTFPITAISIPLPEGGIEHREF